MPMFDVDVDVAAVVGGFGRAAVAGGSDAPGGELQ